MDPFSIRPAVINDLPEIISLLQNDKLGKNRQLDFHENEETYVQAFENIIQDPYQHLMVLQETESQEVIGTLQLSFIQYLTYSGGLRAQIEAVRVNAEYREKGLGKLLVHWAVRKARQEGAHLVQLTSDLQRPEAIKFYENLGFKHSHAGMKLHF